MSTEIIKEGIVTDFLSSAEATSEGLFVPVEIAGSFDHTLMNDNLIRLYVRAFGWEVNRNNFLFNKNALLATHVDAMGAYIPAWKSFEKQLVNANHAMQDNKNSRVDRVIGFIESAELRDDGVYLSLIAWKRTLTDDQIAQIRDGKVAVSMEVTYNNPQVLVDGKSYPPSTVAYDPRTAVRTMADDSVLSFIGIAVLFDGIRPGFGSQEVFYAENAMEDEKALVSRDTHTEVSMEIKELETKLAEADQKQQELAAALEANEADLKAKEEAHAAELAQVKEALEKAQAQIATAKENAFNANLAAVLNLETANEKVKELAKELFGKLDPENAASFVEMAETIAALAACKPKKAKADDEDAATDPCQDGTCGKCPDCLKKQKEKADEEAAAAAAAAAKENAADQSGKDPLVNLAGDGGEAPKFNHKHL